MARSGKIARLPAEVRAELNERLHNGQTGKVVLAWLNGLEPVRAVLAAHFKGVLINEPNLSAWRSNGFAQWREAEETRRLARELRRDGVVSGLEDGTKLAAIAMTLKVAELSRLLIDKECEPLKQWKRLCEIHGHISRMRRDEMAEIGMKIRTYPGLFKKY